MVHDAAPGAAPSHPLLSRAASGPALVDWADWAQADFTLARDNWGHAAPAQCQRAQLVLADW